MDTTLSKLQDRLTRVRHERPLDWDELCDILEDLIYRIDDHFDRSEVD
jgi:hypothetical protein